MHAAHSILRTFVLALAAILVAGCAGSGGTQRSETLEQRAQAYQEKVGPALQQLGALELKPDDARAHFNAGAGYQNMGRYDDAAREFDIATRDEALRQASLVTLAEVLLFQEGTASASARKANASRAKPYIDRLKAEYPDDGRWSVLSFYHRVMSDSILDEADVRVTLSKLDRSDPWQARHAERLERALRQPARPAKRP